LWDLAVPAAHCCGRSYSETYRSMVEEYKGLGLYSSKLVKTIAALLP